MAEQIIYWTLVDSAGTSWYVYPNSDGELTISDTEPTDEANWSDYVYVQRDSSDIIFTADSGIIYVNLVDSAGTDWYIYPNTSGELIITDTEPS